MPAGAWSQAETPVRSDKLGWVGQPYWDEDCVFSVPTQIPGAPVGGGGEAYLPGGDGPIGVAPGPHVRADIAAAMASPEDRASLIPLGRRGRGAWREGKDRTCPAAPGSGSGSLRMPGRPHGDRRRRIRSRLKVAGSLPAGPGAASASSRPSTP